MYFRTLLFISLLGFSYLFADTKLLILGSGTPNPNPERSGSAYAIIANDESYLIDFGPGVIRRASAFSPTWGGEFEAMEIQNLVNTASHEAVKSLSEENETNEEESHF